jgi:3-oxoacyl-[acyl-carrier protein] reductase
MERAGMNLSGKTAIVTGGARDIGRAISVKLARCGAKVVVNYRDAGNPKSAQEVVKQIEDFGGQAFAIAADVTKPAEVDALVKRAVESCGAPIQVLVNNAGGMIARKMLHQMDEQFWDSVIDLNLKSTWLVSQAVLAQMSDGGAIVNVASQAGRDGGGPGSLAYATSKGGIMTFTRGLAKELGPRKIRVNSICPGMINTLFHDRFTSPAVRKKVADSTPLGREGEACEVADLVAYLASDESSFVNGANVDINGGTLFS